LNSTKKREEEAIQQKLIRNPDVIAFAKNKPVPAVRTEAG